MNRQMIAALAMIALTPPLSAQGRTIDEIAGENPNKRLVLEYLDMAWTKGQLDQARAKYFAPDFTNHPPERQRLETAAARRPKVIYEFREAIAEGDIVVVHSIVRGFGIGEPIRGPFGVGGIKVGDDVVDIFRIRNGKIIAKSDTVQATDTEDLFVTR